MTSLRILAATALAVLIASPALAQGNSHLIRPNQNVTATGTGTANSNSESTAVAVSQGGQGGAGGQGGQGGNATASGGTGGNATAAGGQGVANSSIVFNSPGQTSSTVRTRTSGSLKTTANAIAPGLGSAAVETCYGPGVSAGVGFTGGAFSFGMGQYDDECNLRLWARTAYAMGQRDLAGALMAASPTVMRAMQILDQQRQPNGQVVYGATARSASASPYSACKKWSGGAMGVGSCLY